MTLHYPLLSTVQLYTYQKAFMTKFSMVSARLDIELLTAQQRMREVRMTVCVCLHKIYERQVLEWAVPF